MRHNRNHLQSMLPGIGLMLVLPFLICCGNTSNKGASNPVTYASDSITLHQGEQVFNENCASCHSIANEGIGPRLGGITAIRSQSSLAEFINNSEAAIEAGDRRGLLLRKKYKLPMPAFAHLSEAHISKVLSYIAHETERLDLAALIVEDNAGPEKRFAAPTERSGLQVELTDLVQIPRSTDRPPDKGIATLRAHPSGEGTLFVSDQVGIIYRISQARADTFLDLRSQLEHFIDQPGIGTGLGSFAFHPGFVENGLLYTTHAEAYTDKPALNDGVFPDTLGVALQWVISEWKAKDPGKESFEGERREVLRFNTPTTAHGAQDMGFAPGLTPSDRDYGMLYLGIGDGGSNNIKRPELCHNIQSLLGTVIRIDPRGKNSGTGTYGIPPDNPFVSDSHPRTRKEIWAFGFRNPHRMCWDAAHGNRMIVADIGEANVEEINIVEKGGDYGWSEVEGYYGIDMKTDRKSLFDLSASERSRYKGPFAQYDHEDGNAISGGFVYQGALNSLTHTYFFGDIVTGRLFYTKMNPTLSDSTVYEITLMKGGQETSLKQLIPAKRVHLRIGYDPYAGDLFIMTKGDGMIRKVKAAFQPS